jgi:hypothetical protein
LTGVTVVKPRGKTEKCRLRRTTGAHSFVLAVGESTAMGTRVGNFELILMQCW